VELVETIHTRDAVKRIHIFPNKTMSESEIAPYTLERYLRGTAICNVVQNHSGRY